MLLVNQRWYTPTLVSTSDIDFQLVEIVSKWTISRSAQQTFWIFLSLNPYSVLMSFFYSLSFHYSRPFVVTATFLIDVSHGSYFSFTRSFSSSYFNFRNFLISFSLINPLPVTFYAFLSLLFHFLGSTFFISLVIFILFLRRHFFFQLQLWFHRLPFLFFAFTSLPYK